VGAGTQTAGLAFGGTPPTTTATEEYNGSTWSPGGSMSTAREACRAAGTQTAALAFGGNTPTTTAATEEYDGTTWTSGSALGTARAYLAGAGTTNCRISFWRKLHQPVTGANRRI
jgi:hypothetical protein